MVNHFFIATLIENLDHHCSSEYLEPLSAIGQVAYSIPYPRVSDRFPQYNRLQANLLKN